MKNLIRVMLVEDHPEYRDTLVLALSDESGMEMAGQFGTSERALQSAPKYRKGCQTDIILLDLSLPGMHGLDAIPLFIKAFPSARIIVLTQSDREGDVLKAIALGAAGYLLKGSSIEEIAEGIRTVSAGGGLIDAGLAGCILDTLRTNLPIAGTSPLTPRETEILSLVADGRAKKEIADQLGISPHTVVAHVTHIYDKLNVQNAPAAVAKAFGLGILPRHK
jgi:two-component system nitrate/nitrite response regulator NarL